MAFRDDREALRQRIDKLRAELEPVEAERQALSIEIAAAREDVGQQARVRMGATPAIGCGMAASILVLGIVVSFFGGSCAGSSAETFYGEVRATTGAAPVAPGARCTAFFAPQGDSDSDYDGQLTVICDGRILYGGGSLGYLECAFSADQLVTCADGDFTPDGGDPKVLLDRRARQVVVEDRPPAWRVEIELTTPPAELGGD